jgi:ubiquinone/menaquinone biosynthesis C-methylase UbiE
MVTDFADDVPSPIDLRTSKHAQEWAASAMLARPWREHFFRQFVAEVALLGRGNLRILERGSGPGFLAEKILAAVPGIHYTMLDFSPAVHELARQRLGPLMQHVRPVVADFKRAAWSVGLRKFDAVLTNQAVHELRHKRHALSLHRSV